MLIYLVIISGFLTFISLRDIGEFANYYQQSDAYSVTRWKYYYVTQERNAMLVTSILLKFWVIITNNHDIFEGYQES